MTERQIPKKSSFKAAEVCEIAGIKPYVLRSWEQEFTNLGMSKSAGGPRIYRRSDLDQILRIKQLVFEQGLTLAGARRHLEDEQAPQPELPLDELMTADTRERIKGVRQGLRDLLALLSKNGQCL